MQAFSALLDRLAFTPSRTAKLILVKDYVASAQDPERGWALAALTGELTFKEAKPSLIRRAAEARIDPQLFAWSYDFVGDLAETVALSWPAAEPAGPPPGLPEVVDALSAATRSEVGPLIEGWLDALDSTGRWALLKLLTGGLRVGVSAGLAKQALADLARDAGAKVTLADIEVTWHGLSPPYAPLFAWLDGTGPRPLSDAAGRFRPVMLATALDDAIDLPRLNAADFAAEWKWDGARVQAVCERDAAGARIVRLYSRSGEDITSAFPDLAQALEVDAVLDGELLILRPEGAGSFSELQSRLNRKSPSARLMRAAPAGLRAYDLLAEGSEDLRSSPFRERRRRLEALIARGAGPRVDLSPLIPFTDWEALKALRRAPPEGEARKAEGVMLKRWDSAYEAGRPKGPWFKWKRDPFLVDAVLLYAQRGHGRRSSYYSDYTFGVWSAGALTPVGKAYFGFSDEELRFIDRFVRENTTERFGPVRAVRAEPGAGLVLEIAFEGLQWSPRHRAGVALRFPRIHRLRTDKTPAEADTLESLVTLLRALEGPDAPAPDGAAEGPAEGAADGAAARSDA